VVTEHEYDDAGNVIRSTAVREPEYDETDLLMLAAWWEHKAETGDYGENLMDATDPEADPANRQAKYRYVAGVEKNGQRLPLVNYAQKAVQDAQDKYKADNPTANTNGHLWPVERVELPGR
jgi:hypothetical protein